MRQIEIEIVIAVGSLLQMSGNILASTYVIHFFRTSDIAVVRDAAVLVHLEKVVVVGGMHLILLADIAGKDTRIEMRSGLIGIIATPVQIINIEPHGQPLVDIDREIRLETVLAIDLAARLIIRQIGIRHVAVGKKQLVRPHIEAGEGGDEHRGLVISATLQEDAGQARSTQVAQVVVVSFHPLAQVGILEIETGGISRDDGPLAQGLVQPPHIELRGKALDVDGTVFQVVRLQGRVYLVAILVTHGASLPHRVHGHLGVTREGTGEGRQHTYYIYMQEFPFHNRAQR